MDIADLGLWLIALVAIAGAFGQIVDGSVGMGFGVLSTTVMIAGGVDPAVAVGTVALAKLGSGLFSGLSHWGFGNVRWSWVLPLAIAGIAGGATGALLLTHLPGEAVRLGVPLILLALGLLLLRRFWSGAGSYLRPVAGGGDVWAATAEGPLWRRLAAAPTRLSSTVRLAIVGGAAGILNGLSGAYGPLATPGVMLVEGGHPRYAIGTVNLSEIFVTGAVSTVLVAQLSVSSDFHWQLPVALIAGSALTAPLAAYLSRRLPTRALGLTVGLTLISINVWAILRVLL
ncbi:MAG: sulfite exporter TauE/SafE family protein [Chloroflexi bacterium]|nr:sulfite exporter TauE/SafE family protein [Chloroflexota bacterium]